MCSLTVLVLGFTIKTLWILNSLTIDVKSILLTIDPVKKSRLENFNGISEFITLHTDAKELSEK